MRWARHVAHIGESRDVYGVYLGQHEGKRLVGRARLRWKDNIKMDLQEVGCEGMDWIDLAQDGEKRWDFVNAVMKLRVT
jgi:hypothetical protein